MTRVPDLLAHHVVTRPDALAVEDAVGVRWTYAEFDAEVTRFADVLRGGVSAGDRVVIVCENCAAVMQAVFAIWQLDAIAVPINARMTTPELDRIITHADPVLILFTGHASPDAKTHALEYGAPNAGQPLAAVMRGATGGVADPDVAVILYTTGTTGVPKGVMLSHANVCFGAKTSAHLRSITHDDVIYGVLPTTHVFGLCSVLVAAVHAGAPVRLVPRFVVADVFDALRDGITLFSAVPQMHALLMAHARALGLKRLGSETLRYVSSGAAPLDPTWKREAEAFYGVAVQNGYGMTESTAGIAATLNAIGDPDTSVGPALPGIDVDIDMSVLGGGDGAGEVLTRGPHVMPGYFRNLEATGAVLGDGGWLRTGDLGRIDDLGRLHILGRSKELIIHGGFNVYPPEVEAALNDHKEVVQAAVVGRSVGGDEEVLAFVQIAPGCALTVEDLRAFVAQRLAGYKRPARYVLATSLPAAPTGKILKHKLIEVFEDQLA